MDDLKPPALPVALDIPAPALPPKISPRARALQGEKDRLEALSTKEKERQKFHADIKVHLAEANHPELNTNDAPHPFVHEHAALRGLHLVKMLDPVTMTWVDRPCWQIQALVARFHAHGLRHDARISHQHFEAALDETLNGSV